MADLDSLLQSMGDAPDSPLSQWMVERGVALADEETMSQAIHDVYCGIAADHPVPNAKDHAQALALIDSLRRQMETRPPA